MGWQIETLDFEAGLFGAPVRRVTRILDDGADLVELMKGCVSDGVWLVSARTEQSDIEGSQELLAAGFKQVENLITLSRSLPRSLKMPKGVRIAKAGDEQRCLNIAKSGFAFDRFHADVRIPDAIADVLKEKWVSNNFAGRADIVLIVENQGNIAGFVSCLTAADVVIIDLIAVAPEHQGAGCGTLLLQGAMSIYAGQMKTIRVGTQETNIKSMLLYERNNFIPQFSQATYHWIGVSSLVDG